MAGGQTFWDHLDVLRGVLLPLSARWPWGLSA